MTTTYLTPILLVLTLGFRHGLDLDHLATIDAITRKVSAENKLSKFVGFLFSLGHGLVITCLSLIIGCKFIQSQTPTWLDGFGSWISVFFLLLFGSINLVSLFQNNSSSPTQTAGLKSFLIQKIPFNVGSPIFVMSIGALFAFSFDTFTQVSLFSISATNTTHWIFSGILGIVFMLGMMVSDGLNGYFTSALIKKGRTYILSRIIGFTISFFSLSIGGWEAVMLLTNMFE